jgi:phosphoheptose isomerase
MESWRDYVGALTAGLDGLTVTTLGGAPLTPAEGFDRWLRLTREVQQAGRMRIIGNGGSAMIAATWRPRLERRAPGQRSTTRRCSRPSATTSRSDIFAPAADASAQRGDLLVAISSSGESPNVLRAPRPPAH